MSVGTVFETSNETVQNLPVGAVFVKVADLDDEFGGVIGSEVEVTEVPTIEQSFEPGDRIATKYGPATVVRASSKLSINKSNGASIEDYVLYVADSDPVVRRINRADLQ